MTVFGGCWFWFFLRVDVYSEAQPWYRIIKADLFVLALIATSLFGLIWSYLQTLNLNERWDDKVFLLFVCSPPISYCLVEFIGLSLHICFTNQVLQYKKI